MDILLLIVGLALLLGGGEVLVRGAVGLAGRWRLSGAVVGAVVLGFGTSMPELLTSLSAAIAGSPGLAVGNVVGSNIANIGLILGLALLLAPAGAGVVPLEDRLWLLAVTLAAVAILALRPTLGRIEGAVLLLGLVVYVWRAMRRPSEVGVDVLEETSLRIAVFLLGGLAALILGATLLVGAATAIARDFGVSETVIGLTIVAVGTSLPELATSLVAARRGQTGLAVGNVVGSNIFNVLAILGVTAALVPIPVPPMLSWLDLAVFAGLAIAVTLALMRGGLSRVLGGFFILIYAGYLLALAS